MKNGIKIMKRRERRKESRKLAGRSACWGLVWLRSGHEGPFTHDEWNGGVKREKKLGGERGVALFIGDLQRCATTKT